MPLFVLSPKADRRPEGPAPPGVLGASLEGRFEDGPGVEEPSEGPSAPLKSFRGDPGRGGERDRGQVGQSAWQERGAGVFSI